MMNEYEAKQEARRQRLLSRAGQLQAAANSLHDRAVKMAEVIPMGQPILIGHHSERRDRNYRARITRAFDRCFQMQKDAGEIAQRAASVGLGGISSDDPDAPDKLREKLAALEATQARRKAINAAWRKAGRPRFDNAEGWTQVGLAASVPVEKLDEIRRRIAIAPYHPEPYPAYSLTNLAANIKRVRERIAVLERRPAETVEKQIGDVRVVEDAQENRVMLFFPGKPDEKVRSDLRSNGFKWSPTRGAWVRMLTNAARYQAQRILETMAGAPA
jgi:hypothetical protein